MRCSNNIFAYFIIFVLITLLLSGCSTQTYSVDNHLHIGESVDLPIVRPSGLADDHVVIPYDSYIYDDAELEFEASLLINETRNKVVTAINPHKRIYPASMTKILTAIVVMDAVEQGTIGLSDTAVIGKKINFNEDNVSVLGLESGDYITVEELLHGLLISSYNDCAIALARYTAGSVSDFVDRMNEKAIELGATNSHFVNPHGLHDNNHYTTPYDLYLIFEEFLKNKTLVQIDAKTSYILTMYRDEEKIQTELIPTNGFLSQSFNMPTGYHITGWKTGTTDKAGSCIILEFVSDETNDRYICLVSNAKDREKLYENIENMLKEIY